MFCSCAQWQHDVQEEEREQQESAHKALLSTKPVQLNDESEDDEDAYVNPYLNALTAAKRRAAKAAGIELPRCTLRSHSMRRCNNPSKSSSPSASTAPLQTIKRLRSEDSPSNEAEPSPTLVNSLPVKRVRLLLPPNPHLEAASGPATAPVTRPRPRPAYNGAKKRPAFGPVMN